MLRVTSLAPDIVEAIVYGKEPEGIILRQLHDGVPLCWRGQRRSGGFSAKPAGA